MTITITAFENSPDRGRGLARDFRVRWALEEVGRPYAVRALSFEALKQAHHRARNPFGQIPTLEQGDLTLFESGAILLHISETWPGLLPADADARARAIAWTFASVATVEPPIVDRSMAFLFEREERWYAQRLPMLDERVHQRLDQLGAHLGAAEWLDGAFSVADVMMVTVLRRLESSGLLDRHPIVTAYIARGVARPAYGRAFAAQRASFEASQA